MIAAAATGVIVGRAWPADARQRLAGGDIGEVTGRHAELGEFVAIGVGLAFKRWARARKSTRSSSRSLTTSARKEDFAARIG